MSINKDFTFKSQTVLNKILDLMVYISLKEVFPHFCRNFHVKTFRPNLVLIYLANPNNFQTPIQNIIRQMAWLYRFDYATKIKTTIPLLVKICLCKLVKS
jgi:hypothetical protein